MRRRHFPLGCLCLIGRKTPYFVPKLYFSTAVVCISSVISPEIKNYIYNIILTTLLRDTCLAVLSDNDLCAEIRQIYLITHLYLMSVNF